MIPKASVIVPSFNKAPELALTLAAFSHQTVEARDFEVIVVDDGSSDGTRELMARVAPGMPQLRYLHQANAGRSAARNAGIAAARGDILVFNDAEAIPDAAFLEQHLLHHGAAGDKVVNGAKYEAVTRWGPELPISLLDDLERTLGGDPDIAVKIDAARRGSRVEFLSAADLTRGLGPLNRFILGTMAHNYDEIQRRFTPQYAGFESTWITIVTQNVSIHRRLIEHAGVFDESFVGWGLEDIELGLRLKLAGARFEYSEGAANYHQMHPGGATSSLKHWREAARNYARFCAKYPRLDVFLLWRFGTGLLSPAAYDALVREYESPAVPDALRADYLATSAELAKVYIELDDPRPLAVWQRFQPDGGGGAEFMKQYDARAGR